MPTFCLGQTSVNLAVEPLTGALAAADRLLAWRLYLALVTRPALRDDSPTDNDLGTLLDSLREMLEQWPAAQIDQPEAKHLGNVVVCVIEMVLLPCLRHRRQMPESWPAVREFCQSFAREIARKYAFPDAGASLPEDLGSNWRANP